MIWRDDDIAFDTRLDDLEAVDDLFQKYGQQHTIAVLAADMDKRPDLVEAIKRRGMIVQLHGWRHDNLRGNVTARQELRAAVDMITRLFGAPPTVLYPPWNLTGVELVDAAAALGLSVSTGKLSLGQYIRVGGDVAEDTINFHYWKVTEALLLEPALRIASASQV